MHITEHGLPRFLEIQQPCSTAKAHAHFIDINNNKEKKIYNAQIVKH